MALAYNSFASHIKFKELLSDEFGHLYRAAEFDKDGIKRTAFLRVFDSAQVPTQDIIDRFATARRIGEILQAANVAGSPKYLESGGIPAIAYDYIPAQPLSRVFEKVHEEGFPVPVDNALLILEKLALALAAGLAVEVEGSSLVHGFLHPGTILVTNDGEGLVAGFGVADLMLGLLDHPEVADAIHPYLAPEVLLTRTASKRADVYSLGAILYQLLTGAPLPTKPEDRDGVLATAELAYDERPIPDDIKELLSRALATRPEERFSSAADFKKELDRLLYGGTYSPTTFNLALFMDRLFRSEIEAEEKERAEEAKVDYAAYLAPEPEPEPLEATSEAPTATQGNKNLLIGIAAAAVVVAVVVLWMVMGREPSAPPIPPTPTAEQVAAEKAAQEERLKQLAAQMIEEQMAEREDQLRTEMTERQQKIEQLQRQLKESENKSSLSAEEQRRKQDLERQIAAEEEAKKLQAAEAEAERQRMLEEARKQAEAKQAATATAVAEQEAAAAAAAEQKPTVPPDTAIAEAAPEPTAAPEQPVAQPAGDDMVVTENMFLEPSAVDTLPVVIKDQPVTWPRLALHSRRKGMVIVQATVDASGAVEDIKILRADEEGFGIPQSVIDSVRKYRFKPATKNGIKVKSYATVTKRYNFRGR